VTSVETPVRTEKLTRRFGRTEALRNLTLDVGRGEVVALIGANGAGKTTALRTIAGALEPTSGRAEVLGVDSRRLGPGELRRIGYVSESQDLPGGLTVTELLAFLRPLYPAWDASFLERMLAQFQIPSSRKIKTLSRGMRAKVSLVSSLAYRPELLLLDEPFSGLDPIVREEMVDGILSFEAREGWSVLLSSHDIDEVERLADRVAIIDRGSLLLAEGIEPLLARHRRVTVVLEAEVEADSRPGPETWCAVERDGRALTFVETRFDEARTRADIQALYPRPSSVTFTTMSLRAIYVVLARQIQLRLDGDKL
jgi:ABC-2 type transport system ATP-binding protein